MNRRMERGKYKRMEAVIFVWRDRLGEGSL